MFKTLVRLTTTYYILTTQSVITRELVRIQLGFSSFDISSYLHYLSVTIFLKSYHKYILLFLNLEIQLSLKKMQKKLSFAVHT